MVDWNIIGITLTHSNDLLCRHFREMAFFWYNRLFCSSFMFLERKRTLRFGKRMKLEELWKHQCMLPIFVLFYAHFSNFAGVRLQWVLFCLVSFSLLDTLPDVQDITILLSLILSFSLSTLFSHSLAVVILNEPMKWIQQRCIISTLVHSFYLQN